MLQRRAFRYSQIRILPNPVLQVLPETVRQEFQIFSRQRARETAGSRKMAGETARGLPELIVCQTIHQESQIYSHHWGLGTADARKVRGLPELILYLGPWQRSRHRCRPTLAE